MSIQNLFSNAKWNKVTFRIQLARIYSTIMILAMLVSAVGVNPAPSVRIPSVHVASGLIQSQ